MEGAAIDERVKGCAEPAEVQRVADFELGAGAALGRLRPGPLDRGSGNVDPGRLSAPARGQQRLLTSAAADVEYAAGQFALVSKPDERGLRAAYVPRGPRRACVRNVPAASHRHQLLHKQRRGARLQFRRVLPSFEQRECRLERRQSSGSGPIQRSLLARPSGLSRRMLAMRSASIVMAARVRVREEGSRISPAWTRPWASH